MTKIQKIEEVKDIAKLTELFDLKDNLKGVQARIPSIKIIHQAQMFTNEDGTDRFTEFEGIIVHHSPINAFWKESFDATGGGTMPDCASYDGEKPFTENPVSQFCYNCPMNQFGSANNGKGKGKACKNSWRLHILPVEGQLPKRLVLPPSQHGAIQDFLIKLVDKKIPHELAVVKFTLKEVKNADGIKFSMIQFDIKGIVTDLTKAQEIKTVKDRFNERFNDDITDTKMDNKTEETPF
jgi:hypothetical protein